MDVDIFIPCFVDQLFPETAMNMVKVLEKVGCNVNYNPKQTCCGQPAYNGGFWADARDVGEKFVQEISGERYIVIPSGSCTGYIRNCYEDLFENSAYHNRVKEIQNNTYEFSEFLIDVVNVDDVGAELNGVATYHDSCAALRECQIKEAPRKLLSKVKGLELKEMKDVETCCGFGGTFSIKYEPISIGMVDQKVINATEQNADFLISTDSSCLMHLQGYLTRKKHSMKTMHLADVLASGW